MLKKPSLNKNELKNYRPVANLPFISKVIEKCAVSQVVNHVNEHNLAEPLQSAYKALHSTETALACVQNDFLRAIDNQQAVFLIMLDLSAAFDTVDATILLQRLDCEFGIGGLVQQWFKTYLDQRSFRVSISGSYSENISLKYGLPQGSVVGPLGFVFYTHTVGRILRLHNLSYHIYADDIQIYITVDPNVPGDAACAIFKLAQCVKDINNWMIQNKLKLNPDKTEFFIACSPHHDKRLQHLSLPLDGTATILPSTEVRNLGVVFDRHMSMSNHITSLCKSINWQIRNINRIRRFIDFETCANTVRALILSRLDYCNLLFNHITQKDLTRLQKLQNKCARLIYQQPRSCHVTPLLTELHWLSVADRITFKTLLCVYKSLNGLCPQYMFDCLVVNTPRPGSVTTRSSHHGLNLKVPKTRKCAGDRAYSVAAPRLWNNLPLHIRNSSSVASFKTLLKTHLFSCVYNV